MNGNWMYAYDAFNRLVSANATGQPYTYAYDRFGNRWQQNGNGPHSSSVSFSGNNNRMDTFSYDAAGNLLSDGTTAYTYDSESRIISATNSISGASTYLYDGDGRRIRKTTTAHGTVDFLYDLSGHEITEVSSSHNWNRGEVYAGGRHLATYNQGTTNFILSDWLGTERARSTPTGAPFETCTSLPFGDALTCSGSSYDASPLHFTGKERDSETGLDNFGARYDSSQYGRFMSPDPLGGHYEDPQTLNKYAYVRNNPITLTDPTGLDFYLSCHKEGGTCGKDANGNLVQGTTTTTTDANGNTTSTFTATVVTSASLQDPNSGNTATVNQNGVQITTANGTAQGIFINNTPAADIQGSGKLSDFEFHIDSSNEKIGTLDAGTYTYEGSRNQPDVVKALTDRGAFQYTAEKVFGNPFHAGDLNFRFSSGAHPELFDYGPSPHLLVPNNPRATVPVGPGYAGQFHIDSHTSDVSHGGCAILGVGCQ